MCLCKEKKIRIYKSRAICNSSYEINCSQAITFLKSNECNDARHGNMTRGNVTATDKTNPNFINSLKYDSEKLISKLPEIFLN